MQNKEENSVFRPVRSDVSTTPVKRLVWFSSNLVWMINCRETLINATVCLFVFWRDSPQWAMASSFLTSLDHSQGHITLGRTPLDEWSPRRRDLYLTTHNTHNIQTSVPPVGFEPTISAGERPQIAQPLGSVNKCQNYSCRSNRTSSNLSGTVRRTAQNLSMASCRHYLALGSTSSSDGSSSD